MPDEIRAAVLIVATVLMGIMTGVFQLYAYAIMPGLRRTDDRTFVGAFQQIDTAIINPLFLSIFLGTLVFTGAACVLHLGADQRALLPWTGVAFVLYLIVVISTLRINVPLNNAIKAAGHPDRISDLRRVREAFNEPRWVRWNLVRSVLCTVALALLAWALALHGRL